MKIPSFYVVYCTYHFLVDTLVGVLILADVHQLSKFVHGEQVTNAIGLDSPNSLIVASEKLVGVMMIGIGLFVLAMTFIPEEMKLLRFLFLSASLTTSFVLLGWRYFVEANLASMQTEWKGQAVGDLLHILGWLFCMFKSYTTPVKNKQS